jgi:hypothetical protein
MELINALTKYHKIVKEEENFNYKYNPLLTSKFNNKRKIADFLNNNIKIRKLKLFSLKNKEKEKIRKYINEKKNKKKFMYDNSFNNQRTILEEKFFLEQINKRKRIIQGNRDKIKGFLTKSQCPCCQKELSVKDKETDSSLKLSNILTDPNKYYLDIRSHFFFCSNNFPLIERKVNTKYFSFKPKFSLENEDKIKIHKISYNNKTSFENDLSKNKKTEKIIEVKREHINTNNLYMIKKPLFTTIRGKIYKNMKLRFKRPLRLVILDEKNNNPINNI